MDKFTKISNELLEALCRVSLSKAEYKAVLYIIRKTVGWNKQADRISISKMADDVGMPRRTMIRAVRGLEDKNIISVERSAGHTGKIILQPVAKWTHVTKSTRVKNVTGGVTKATQVGVTKVSQVPVTPVSHTKDIYKDISKDNYQKTAPYGGDNPWDDVITDEEAEAWANT